MTYKEFSKYPAITKDIAPIGYIVKVGDAEYRVKNKLTYKYGTIRIYARDYYYNGSYITTQCFII